jgi:hypothetical protein
LGVPDQLSKLGSLPQGTKVVVPWRPDNGEREALWAFCSRWWGAQSVSPTLSPSPDGPFNRGAAINAGLTGDWDVAVVMDADVICSRDQIELAVYLAQRHDWMVLAFERYIGLAPWGNRRLLETGDPAGCGALRVVYDHESSVFAIGRELWERVGGFDERFVGWGQDDVAFCQSCRILGGVERVPGDVWHLWHEPSPTKWPGDALKAANQKLGALYREARTAADLQEVRWGVAQPSLTTSTPATHGTV